MTSRAALERPGTYFDLLNKPHICMVVEVVQIGNLVLRVREGLASRELDGEGAWEACQLTHVLDVATKHPVSLSLSLGMKRIV